jgi:hypothetical protein
MEAAVDPYDVDLSEQDEEVRGALELLQAAATAPHPATAPHRLIYSSEGRVEGRREESREGGDRGPWMGSGAWEETE